MYYMTSYRLSLTYDRKFHVLSRSTKNQKIFLYFLTPSESLHFIDLLQIVICTLYLHFKYGTFLAVLPFRLHSWSLRRTVCALIERLNSISISFGDLNGSILEIYNFTINSTYSFSLGISSFFIIFK